MVTAVLLAAVIVPFFGRQLHVLIRYNVVYGSLAGRLAGVTWLRWRVSREAMTEKLALACDGSTWLGLRMIKRTTGIFVKMHLQ